MYVLPSLLGENDFAEVLPPAVNTTIEKLDHFIVENEKQARRYIKTVCPDKKQEGIRLYPINKHIEQDVFTQYIKVSKSGVSMGLLSDAGCPGIADPGAEIVALAHFHGIRVKPITGPSSILLAMMSSGLNGQNFAFNGYLPIDKNQRKKAILHFEKKSIQQNQSQLFIETPYRNQRLLEEFLKTLNANTKLCIACDLTLETEFIKTLEVSQWARFHVNLHKRPSIFIIQG